jgi:hypothetical protein
LLPRFTGATAREFIMARFRPEEPAILAAFGRTAGPWLIIARMSLSEILLIIALIVFVVAAIGWSYKKTDLVCVGLALWSLSELITRGLSSLTLSTILLILAFIAFVLGAIGWGYKKIGLIAVGLALWVASIVLPMIIH